VPWPSPALRGHGQDAHGTSAGTPEGGIGRAQEAAEKLAGSVILRSQQATKNLQALENTECRSFAQKTGLRMTAFVAFFRSLSSPALPPQECRVISWALH
jgi:hypothetical protein